MIKNTRASILISVFILCGFHHVASQKNNTAQSPTFVFSTVKKLHIGDKVMLYSGSGFKKNTGYKVEFHFTLKDKNCGPPNDYWAFSGFLIDSPSVPPKSAVPVKQATKEIEAKLDQAVVPAIPATAILFNSDCQYNFDFEDCKTLNKDSLMWKDEMMVKADSEGYIEIYAIISTASTCNTATHAITVLQGAGCQIQILEGSSINITENTINAQ